MGLCLYILVTHKWDTCMDQIKKEEESSYFFPSFTFSLFLRQNDSWKLIHYSMPSPWIELIEIQKRIQNVSWNMSTKIDEKKFKGTWERRLTLDSKNPRSVKSKEIFNQKKLFLGTMPRLDCFNKQKKNLICERQTAKPVLKLRS